MSDVENLITNVATSVANPLGTRADEPPVRREIAAEREIAEVQGAILMARRFPRDEIKATDRILQACTRPGLAEAALYNYSRGGTEISGPSIRLAEAIAQAWGNISFGTRELAPLKPGEATMEAYCWDLETNVRPNRVFQVPHVRQTRSSSTRLTDNRDISELNANMGARRMRACILATIPGDVVEAAVQQCEATMLAKADTSPEAVGKLVKAFEQFGVTRDQIETRIQRRIDTIRPAQIVQLRKVWASLNDGMSVAADWFQAKQPEPGAAPAPEPEMKGSEGLKAKLNPQRGTSAPAASPPADAPAPGEAATPVSEPGTATAGGSPATSDATSAGERPQGGARTAAAGRPTSGSATPASPASPDQTASGPQPPAEPSSDGELPLREPGEEG